MLRRIDEHVPSEALFDLCEAYKFWIAFADVDGYRVDTVKHIEPGAVRVFANVIHEFAQSLRKDNFYLIGEITGGRERAVTLLDTTGIDAALGINDIPDKLEFLAKGYRSPGDPETAEQEGYFDLFRNSLIERKPTHQWFGRHVVTMFDDHDQVGTKHKFRFCGQPYSYPHLWAALGLNLGTMRIPCIYYGTEQAFDGADHRQGDDDDRYSDVFLRECMFGGPFGSLQSTGRHFFNEQHDAYRFIQSSAALRQKEIALRRGRQYLRQVSATGLENDFHFPQMIGVELRWVVAWSRIFADREVLCAINTDAGRELTVYATIDHHLNPPGTEMECLLSMDSTSVGHRTAVEARNGSALRITLPAGGGLPLTRVLQRSLGPGLGRPLATHPDAADAITRREQATHRSFSRAIGARRSPPRIHTSLADIQSSLPKLSPERAHRANKGLGTLQRCVLQNAPSSLLVLFGPQAIASQERLRFFDPLRQIHVDDPIRAKILGEGSRSSSGLADNQGRAPWLPRAAVTRRPPLS